MSYSTGSAVYQPRNTGEDYMRNNFHFVSTARASSPNSKISFSGSSGSKKWLIAALAVIGFLLLAAIVIIILFATGVLGGSDETVQTLAPGPFTNAPIVDRFVNRTFTCEVFILKQANSYYDDANSFYTLQAKRIASEAIASVLGRTPIGGLGLRTELVGLSNSGEDVALRFRLRIRVPQSSDIDATVIRNTVLTTRTLNELSTAMNGVAIDTSPARVLVQLS
ncbi:unnamed protein product, partial [Mesorhabditis spiculigera]